MRVKYWSFQYFFTPWSVKKIIVKNCKAFLDAESSFFLFTQNSYVGFSYAIVKVIK